MKIFYFLFLEAVMKKFNYTAADISFVWPPIHDSILSKRRNQQKKLKSSVNPSNILLILKHVH